MIQGKRSSQQRFQPSQIFRDCPEIKHHVLKSRNTVNLSRIQALSSTFEENPKFLFFHSPKNLFFYKLTSYSTASSTIFKYFKSRWWCLFKNSSFSVYLYLENLIPRPNAFRTCAKIIIIRKSRLEKQVKNRFYYMKKKQNKNKKKIKTLVKGLLMWRKICSVSGNLSRQRNCLGK